MSKYKQLYDIIALKEELTLAEIGRRMKPEMSAGEVHKLIMGWDTMFFGIGKYLSLLKWIVFRD